MACFCPKQQDELVRKTLTSEEYSKKVMDFFDGNECTEKDIYSAISQYYKLEQIQNNILIPMFKFCSEVVNGCCKNNINTYETLLTKQYICKFKKISEDLESRIEFLELIKLILIDNPLDFVKCNQEYLKDDVYNNFFYVSKEKISRFAGNFSPEKLCFYIKSNIYPTYISAYEFINSLFLSLHPVLEINFSNLVYITRPKNYTAYNVLRRDDIDMACNNMEKIKSEIIVPIYKFCNRLINSKFYLNINPSYVEKFDLLIKSLSNPICCVINNIKERIYKQEYTKKFLCESKLLAYNDIFLIIFEPDHVSRNKKLIKDLKDYQDYLFDKLRLQGVEYTKELYENIDEIISSVREYLSIFY